MDTQSVQFALRIYLAFGNMVAKNAARSEHHKGRDARGKIREV